ncbi:1,4-alpha-glucan branching protein GlgB [Paenibacillus sp. KACC 21273]|uniref:1,4-alpha-glucan branching protein GlgB n=1 Tax=Paenibacillus sp. KACC 21273 TaxID=3025665 RepID=UPI002365598C|nr:1,4-alpha-glucan branching protein GlgB [Paenibacillus sp. KACC 21273]WDF52806.1 1,4-alpha-glucan branching protein GlgB [Paenibacillus sp. KACC 21273]
MSQKRTVYGEPTPEELYLFHEGTNFHTYRHFGSHVTSENGESGVRFSVWAPHAARVGVAGDWNNWDGEYYQLHKLPNSGVWTGFLPNIHEGTLYKYHITSSNGDSFLKADPYAHYAEVRPATASVVASLSGYTWNDAVWRRKRRAPYRKPLNIYEMHFGTWKQKEDGSFYTYRELADLLIPYLVDMGYTHLELMPLTEHPYDLSWGYQSTGYFAPTSRYGTPQELMYFVDACHQANIGVILDWVPGHFTKDAHGLRMFDGTPLYEYADPDRAEKIGWGTLSFDFSKPEVRSFLISSALYWMEMFHFDGLRVDAVTSMIRLDFGRETVGGWKPNEQGGAENKEAILFLQQLNKTIFQYYPHALMMAEESSAWPGVTKPAHENGLGFNYKWSMGWMNDTLDYMESDFEQRPEKHNLLTFPITYAFAENATLPLSHDEVVHGKKSLLDKMPGAYEQKFAGLRLLLAYQMTHPGKKLLFMGGEFGQFIEWKDQDQLDWLLLEYDMHQKMKSYTRELNHLYLQLPALWEQDHEWQGYEWLNADDAARSVITYMRKGKKTNDTLIIAINFQPIPQVNYRVGVPKAGTYEEIWNSDEPRFGGTGGRTESLLFSEKVPFYQQEQSIEMTLPPLSVIILKRRTSNRRKL